LEVTSFRLQVERKFKIEFECLIVLDHSQICIFSHLHILAFAQ